MTGTPSVKITVPEGIKGHKTISITGKDVVKGNTTDVAVIQGTSTDIVWTSMQMHLHLIILWLMM